MEITEDERTALCTVTYNMKLSGKYLDIAHGLIALGLIREVKVWELTETGLAALGPSRSRASPIIVINA